MQTLLLPAIRPCSAASSPTPSQGHLTNSASRRPYSMFLSQSKQAGWIPHCSFISVSSTRNSFGIERNSRSAPFFKPHAAFPESTVSSSEDADKSKLAQVAKRLEATSRYFRRIGNFAFWAQLVCSVVAAGILSFSVVVTGKITSAVTFYATAGGLVAAFISIFWSFGYIRLSEQLRRTANDPSKAPPRADVVLSLRNGVVLNLIGMGAAVLGLQATVGMLVGKALTSSANPYYQGVTPGYSPVLALDVFLVQACANTILSHFFGLASSLELLRSVTVPPESVPTPRAA